MDIYRISVEDMMGFRVDELFFSTIEKARSKYAELLIEYRNDKNIVKRGDETHLSAPIVRGLSESESIIKQHMIEVWQEIKGEYSEWDTTVIHLSLDVIKLDQ